MPSKKVCAVILTGLLLFMSIFLAPKLQAETTDSYSAQTASAVNYLVRNYNSSIGLIHDSPDEVFLNNTYWLYSDNFLALLALSDFKSNATISMIHSNISAAVSYWSKTQPDVSNQYQVLNDTSVFPFSASQNFNIGLSQGATINSTVNNQTGSLSPQDYADIAFLEAIAYKEKGQNQFAADVYNIGMANWSGFGFKDNAYNGTYATFKTALYILASKALGYSYNQNAMTNLLNCQLTSGVGEGGFATSYTGNGIPASGTNTETTSLAILALHYTSPIPEFGSWALQTALAVGVVIVVFGLVVAAKKKKSA